MKFVACIHSRWLCNIYLLTSKGRGDVGQIEKEEEGGALMDSIFQYLITKFRAKTLHCI
jgi:hypothetical protein